MIVVWSDDKVMEWIRWWLFSQLTDMAAIPLSPHNTSCFVAWYKNKIRYCAIIQINLRIFLTTPVRFHDYRIWPILKRRDNYGWCEIEIYQRLSDLPTEREYEGL